MLVYRVEDPKGMGPYSQEDADERSTITAVRFRVMHNNSENHPALMDDEILIKKVINSKERFGKVAYPYVTSTALFGFISLSSFNAWFGEHRDMLREGGFKISVFEVPADDVIYSEKQAMFISERATLVKSIEV